VSPSPDAVRTPSTYRHLLRLPDAARFAATAAAGRVGIAMTGLGLLLLVRARTGSYADAGAVVAAFAVAEALLGPQVARLIDRCGQTRVVPVAVTAHAAAVAGLLLGAAPPLVLAALAGATIPQLGALSTARWVALLRRRDLGALLPTAFSLESLVNALAYLAGPVLVTVLAGAVAPALGTATAGVLVVGSGLGLALQRSTSPVPGPALAAGPGRRPALLRTGFLAVVAVNLALGVHFGASQVAVTAFAAERGAPETAGVLFGISSAAGLLAGWAYGRRRWRTPAPRQLALLGAALALACGVLAATTSLPVAGAALLIAGAVVPPVLVLSTVLAEGHVPARSLTQALTWLNSAAAGGSAAATALAGLAVDRGGAGAAFLLSVAAGGALLLVATAGSRALGHTGGVRSDEAGRR